MYDPTVNSDIARARTIGITVTLDYAGDRATDPLPRYWPVQVDQRGIGTRPVSCPTCEDGILTIVFPVRCQECSLSGL